MPPRFRCRYFRHATAFAIDADFRFHDLIFAIDFHFALIVRDADY
jgi:hypothetical protein